MLGKINVSKAAGPDLIPGRMLNMLAPELAPIVHAIFTQSLETGELPRDRSLANVAPIFKKGNRVLAENYRPVSLTCITCKQGPHSFSFFELKFKDFFKDLFTTLTTYCKKFAIFLRKLKIH